MPYNNSDIRRGRGREGSDGNETESWWWFGRRLFVSSCSLGRSIPKSQRRVDLDFLLLLLPSPPSLPLGLNSAWSPRPPPLRYRPLLNAIALRYPSNRGRRVRTLPQACLRPRPLPALLLSPPRPPRSLKSHTHRRLPPPPQLTPHPPTPTLPPLATLLRTTTTTKSNNEEDREEQDNPRPPLA